MFGKWSGFVDHTYGYWPDPAEIKPFFSPEYENNEIYHGGGDDAVITLEGIDGTEHLQLGEGRKDIVLMMWFSPKFGVMLFYHRYGIEDGEIYYSKGDMSKIHTVKRNKHSDPLPVALFIPFDDAFNALEDFINSEGKRSDRIEWVSGLDIPSNTFPPQHEVAHDPTYTIVDDVPGF
ncbi:MAG: hypothetical protein AAF468_21095 [Pseudomonadota bacterium]